MQRAPGCSGVGRPHQNAAVGAAIGDNRGRREQIAGIVTACGGERSWLPPVPAVRDRRASCRLAASDGPLAPNVEHNNCCRQQQSFPGVREALEGRRWRETVRCPERPNHARDRSRVPAASKPETAARKAASWTTRSRLDALAGHAGYAVRRFQIWIFQDFIRTLGAVDIRPTQYSVMTVIGANPGLSQMAVAKRLGIERARLVHLLGQPRTARSRQPRPIGHRPALPRPAPDRARQDRAGAVQAARRRA